MKIRTLKGGPAPETMRTSLVEAGKASAQLEQWLTQKSQAILQAEERLEKILQGWDEHE